MSLESAQNTEYKAPSCFVLYAIDRLLSFCWQQSIRKFLGSPSRVQTQDLHIYTKTHVNLGMHTLGKKTITPTLRCSESSDVLCCLNSDIMARAHAYFRSTCLCESDLKLSHPSICPSIHPSINPPISPLNRQIWEKSETVIWVDKINFCGQRWKLTHLYWCFQKSWQFAGETAWWSFWWTSWRCPNESISIHLPFLIYHSKCKWLPNYYLQAIDWKTPLLIKGNNITVQVVSNAVTCSCTMALTGYMTSLRDILFILT